jgi:hypothetical protein
MPNGARSVGGARASVKAKAGTVGDRALRSSRLNVFDARIVTGHLVGEF